MFKKITSLFLAVTMVVTMSGGGYQMAYAAPDVNQPQNPKETKTASSDEYVQGQAIIVYKSNKVSSSATTFSAKSAKKTANLDSSIQVEDTWHFNGAEENAAPFKISPRQQNSNKNKYSAPIGDVNIALVKSDKLSTEELIKQLKQNPAIQSAEPNRIAHPSSINDEYFAHQWAHENHGQQGGVAGISANSVAKWNKGEKGKDKIVAIIDTGVDYNHPDLKDSMWKNTHYPALKGKCGYDVAENDSDPMDLDGHGTHCAGIMAAQANNSIGVSGIAPEAKIMALKAFDDAGYMDTATTLNAFDYISKAIDLGENVVALNNSWGTGFYQYSVDVLTTLLGQKGVVSVFASGNDSLDTSTEGAESSASFNNPYALFVNSISEDGAPSLFTNYGEETDLFAPGSTILSTVSSPTYNPSIYTDEQQKKFSQRFNNFENKDNKFAIPDAATLTSNLKHSKATVKVEVVDNKFVGTKSSGKSLKLTFDHVQPDEFLSVSCPYVRVGNPTRHYGAQLSAMVQMNNQQEPTTDQFTEIFVSDVLKGHAPKTINECYNLNTQLYDQIAGETHSWDHLLSKLDPSMNQKNQNRELVYSIWPEVPGKQEIYIDDIGISHTDANPDDFGKYDFYNGTSMAAPYVTGAIALLDSEIDNGQNGKPIDGADRVHNLMSHVTKSPSLENLCSSGAYLDVSKTVNNDPTVSKVQANHDKDTIDISGFGLSDSNISVKIDGQAQPIQSQNDNQIIIKNNGWIGSTVHMEISTPSKVLYSKDLSFQEPKKPYLKMTDFQYPEYPNEKKISTTDGVIMYYATPSNGNVYSIDTSDGDEIYIGHVDTDKLFDYSDEGNTYITENFVYADGKLYAVAALDYDYGMDLKLIRIDIKSGYTTDLGYLPDCLAALKDFTMVAYDGDICFIGGYDEEAQKTSTQVLVYVVDEDAYYESQASLPEGRAGGQAFQTKDDKLIYTLGYSEKTKVADGKKQPVNQIVAPENIVFSGDDWYVAGDPAPVIIPTKVNNDGDYYNSFEQSVGICEEGLVYAGAHTRNLGDTFIFNVDTNQYTPMEYQLYDDVDFTRFTGMAIGDYFYGNTMDFSVKFPINPGTVQVTSPNYVGGRISNANVPTTPGNRIFIKPIAKKNFFTRSFTVNGQKSNINGRYVRLTKNIKATTSFGRRITSIGVKKTQIKLKTGRTYKLSPKVYPTNATYKQLTYKSSNPKYVTVSPTGLIKAKSNGAGRKATITIRAKSKSNAYKKVFVTVVR